MKVANLLLLFFGIASSLEVTLSCDKLFKMYSLSPDYNETIAHAIHSLTYQDLLKIEPDASYPNTIPVVNPQLRDASETERVKIGTPYESLGSSFYGDTMNTIDQILSKIGRPDDFGPNWTPLARIIHRFHMEDLWLSVIPSYKNIKGLLNAAKENGLGKVADLCACLKDIKSNGIYDAVDFAAQHYSSNTILLSLTDGPEKPFQSAADWQIYKDHMLPYYSRAARYDVAVFLYCQLV